MHFCTALVTGRTLVRESTHPAAPASNTESCNPTPARRLRSFLSSMVSWGGPGGLNGRTWRAFGGGGGTGEGRSPLLAAGQLFVLGEEIPPPNRLQQAESQDFWGRAARTHPASAVAEHRGEQGATQFYQGMGRNASEVQVDWTAVDCDPLGALTAPEVRGAALCMALTAMRRHRLAALPPAPAALPLSLPPPSPPPPTHTHTTHMPLRLCMVWRRHRPYFCSRPGSSSQPCSRPPHSARLS